MSLFNVFFFFFFFFCPDEITPNSGLTGPTACGVMATIEGNGHGDSVQILDEAVEFHIVRISLGNL